MVKESIKISNKTISRKSSINEGNIEYNDSLST